jgi:hypothetical protein
MEALDNIGSVEGTLPALPRAMTRAPSILIAVLSACGSDPVAFSAPVGINEKAKSGDVAGDVISEAKDIETESGNPYMVFMNGAHQALGGRDPSRIELTSLTLLLGAQSTNVTKLEEVFTGRVDALFLVNDTNNTFPVGHITSPTGGGPVTMEIDLNSDSFTGVDRTNLLAGKFKVVVRGSAAAGFAALGAEANLQLTLQFSALE